MSEIHFTYRSIRPNRPHRPPSLARWWGLAAGIFIVDQITKWIIVNQFNLYESLTVTSFFNLVRVHNTGAAFSFLADAGGWQRWALSGIAVGAIVFIVWMLRGARGQAGMCLALSLILGGALGNLIDRLLFGYVVDFLQFHWSFLEIVFRGGYFPSFNVADSAITVGAVLLLWLEFFRPKADPS